MLGRKWGSCSTLTHSVSYSSDCSSGTDQLKLSVSCSVKTVGWKWILLLLPHVCLTRQSWLESPCLWWLKLGQQLSRLPANTAQNKSLPLLLSTSLFSFLCFHLLSIYCTLLQHCSAKYLHCFVTKTRIFHLSTLWLQQQ